MTAGHRQVVVLGGGISGLTAAWHLKRNGADVCVLEAVDQPGGCARTEQRDGFLLEKGPFNVIVRDPAFEDLLTDLSDELRACPNDALSRRLQPARRLESQSSGQALRVVPAARAARRRYIYRHGAIHPVPAHPLALMTTPLLSFSARCRFVRGLILADRAGPFEQTIERAAARRFGIDAAETFVSAVIAGIYAGDMRKLSLDACFPSVADLDRRTRSLIGYGLAAAARSVLSKKRRRKRRWRGLVSFDGGLGALTGAIARRLGGDVRTSCRARSVERTGDGFAVTYLDAAGETRAMTSDTLVVALSAGGAAAALRPIIPDAAGTLDSLPCASLVVMNLGFRCRDVQHPLDGFGFLVPQNEPDFPLMGVLFADSVFPHHAPAEHRLLRVFVGGSRDPSAVARSDAELLASANRALRDVLGVSGEPCLVDICRHRAAIPQYHPGHREMIARVRKATVCVPGLHLIGNYLEGVSLNDCVCLATRVASEIIESKREPRPNQPSRLHAPAPNTSAPQHAAL